jgi:hypothetical protein
VQYVENRYSRREFEVLAGRVWSGRRESNPHHQLWKNEPRATLPVLSPLPLPRSSGENVFRFVCSVVSRIGSSFVPETKHSWWMSWQVDGLRG